MRSPVQILVIAEVRMFRRYSRRPDYRGKMLKPVIKVCTVACWLVRPSVNPFRPWLEVMRPAATMDRYTMAVKTGAFMRTKERQFPPVSRRSLFLHGAAAALGTAGLLAVPGNPQAAAKKTQQQVAYQTSPKGSERCDNCSLFIKPNRCRSVAGTIAPQGWCKIWAY